MLLWFSCCFILFKQQMEEKPKAKTKSNHLLWKSRVQCYTTITPSNNSSELSSHIHYLILNPTFKPIKDINRWLYFWLCEKVVYSLCNMVPHTEANLQTRLKSVFKSTLLFHFIFHIKLFWAWDWWGWWLEDARRAERLSPCALEALLWPLLCVLELSAHTWSDGEGGWSSELWWKQRTVLLSSLLLKSDCGTHLEN